MHQATETVSTGKLFSLGSKNRYSGRSEKQSSQEPASRPQPHVLRTPSRRQQRRTASDVPISNGIVGNDDGGFLDYPDGMVTTVVQPKSERSHRQGHSNAADSPRSTRSAPWEMGNSVKGGMYTTGRDSPMSTRSEKMKFPGPRRSRESGSESEASYHHRRRGHHSRKSDNESDQERRRRRRSRHENSGSESEASHQRRYRHRRSGQDMLSSEAKWKEVQRKLEKNDMIASPEGRAHSMKSNGSLASDHGSEDSGKRKRRTRRRSRSPGKRPPEELRQHFEYDLVDPETIGLNEEQMRDIPYTKVETSAEPFKIKYSPHMRQRYKSPRRRSHGSDLNEAGMGRIPGGEPVPAHQQMYPPPTTQQMYQSNTQQQKYPSNTQQQKYPSSAQQHNRRSMPEVQYKNAYGHQNNGEEMVQPPPSVQKAELHTAPIVKTKPVAVFTALAPDNIPHPYPIMPLEDITNLSKNNKFSKPSDGKHQHHDSGLGIDQELSSSPKSNIGIAVSLKPKEDVNKYPVESTPKNGTSLEENGGRMRTRDAKSGPLNNRLSAIQGYQDEATSGYSKTVMSNIPQSSTCTGNSSMQSKSRQQETNSRPTYVEQVSNIPGNKEQNGQSSVLGSQQTKMLRAQESQKSQILASPVARVQDSPASQTKITPLMARLHDKGQHNYGSPTARLNVPGSRKDGVGQVNSAFTPVSGSTVSRKEVLNCSLSSELLSQVLSSSGRNKDIFTEL
ncbi:uncharacterized protein LOC106155058 [Lingula anatina]|uniref:Uncharacterized protein LOC106155058 n=1 Tax=Lingula anatina TaxID=7574 RepID=A0A1S3HI19_LINAN|nr:uncharacterized protein LOC106155058 [Lingula anatina]|eukprot:XP_013385126.1 uncharacterized protein LOC106155058 [Lingula anatina]